jgi:hypothetical protein
MREWSSSEARARATTTILAVALGAWVIGAAGSVRADAPLEAAQARYEEADFEGALLLLEEAAASTTLSRQELVTLLELRAVLRLATGQRQEMQADMARLLSLDPEHAFARGAPPELVAAAAALRASGVGPVLVEARAEPTADGARVDADATDEHGVVRSVMVRTRRDGDGWSELRPPPVDLPLDPGARLAYFALALGPGGVVVARDGSEESPHELVDRRSGATPAPLAAQDDDSTWTFVAIAGAAAVVAIAVVVTAVLVTDAASSQSSDLTRPELPVLVRF